MKKITLYVFALLLSGMAVLYSCQKKDEDKKMTSNQGSRATDNLLIADAMAYFKTYVQPNTTSTNAGYRQGLKKTPRWNEAYVTSLSNGSQGVIVPLKYENNIFLISKLNSEPKYDLQSNSYLLITLGDDKKTANVITTIPGKYLSDNKWKVSEYILKEDWAGNLVEKYAIINHKIRKFNLALKNTVKTNSIAGGCQAVSWYLCTLETETNTYYNCVYTHTEYINCDEPDSEVGNETTCDVPDLSIGVITSDEVISQELIPINSTQKYNNPKWICLKSNSWHLESQELGKVTNTDPVLDIWCWDELSHSSINFIGSFIGGTCSHSNGVATFNFVPGAPNIQSTSEELTFNVTYTPALNCIPIVGNLFPPVTKTYTSHAVFNAKP